MVGGDSDNGRATADACTSGNQIGQLPVQSQRLADEVTAAKAGQQGEDHYCQGHLAYVQDGGDVQRQPQQDNGEFQYLLGGELQPCGEHIRLANELVKKHANEHGNYRRANQVDGQQALKPAARR